MGSLLLWVVLLLGFNDSLLPFGRQFWGCWALYLVTESFLTAVCASSWTIDACDSLSRFGIHVLRLSILFLLCCIPGLRGCYARLVRNRMTDFDEERTLLLSQETCYDDQSGGNINYLTIGHDQSPSDNTETKRRKNGFLESLDTVRVCSEHLFCPSFNFTGYIQRAANPSTVSHSFLMA